MQNGRSKPRVPFGSLVELGIIKPGTTIFDNKKKISAKIMADGSIKHEQTEGSIHKVAATILELKAAMVGLFGTTILTVALYLLTT